MKGTQVQPILVGLEVALGPGAEISATMEIDSVIPCYSTNLDPYITLKGAAFQS